MKRTISEAYDHQVPLERPMKKLRQDDVESENEHILGLLDLPSEIITIVYDYALPVEMYILGKTCQRIQELYTSYMTAYKAKTKSEWKIPETPEDVTRLGFLYHAAKHGYLNVLRYGWLNISCTRDMQHGAFNIALVNGHVKCAKYILSQLKNTNDVTYAIDTNYIQDVALAGHVESLKLIQNLLGIEKMRYHMRELMLAVAQHGLLQVLQYAHEIGVEFDEDTCMFAACYGGLECLKFLHNIGCKWDEHVTSSAVQNGYLQCLEYAHRNGCSWNQETSYNAASYGYLECFKYAYENGCPTDVQKCYHAAKRKGYNDIVRYCRKILTPGNHNIV